MKHFKVRVWTVYDGLEWYSDYVKIGESPEGVQKDVREEEEVYVHDLSGEKITKIDVFQIPKKDYVTLKKYL